MMKIKQSLIVLFTLFVSTSLFAGQNRFLVVLEDRAYITMPDGSTTELPKGSSFEICKPTDGKDKIMSISSRHKVINMHKPCSLFSDGFE